MQAEVEVKASRYRTPDQAVVPEETPIPEGSEVGSGGRQKKKAQVRRHAAEAGMDVRSWLGYQALEVKQSRLARQRLGPYVGSAEASQRFWEAARGSGPSVCLTRWNKRRRRGGKRPRGIRSVSGRYSVEGLSVMV